MQDIILQLQSYVLEAGIWGPVIYILSLITAIVASPIPASPLAVFAGITFGWMKAMLLTIIGATLGAAIAFYIARKLGRPLVEKIFSPEKLKKVEKLMPEKSLIIAIFLLRIQPLPLFDIVSYAAGLTKVSAKNFIIATILGLIPSSFVLSFFGELANKSFYIGISAMALLALAVIIAKLHFKKKKQEPL